MLQYGPIPFRVCRVFRGRLPDSNFFLSAGLGWENRAESKSRRNGKMPHSGLITLVSMAAT